MSYLNNLSTRWGVVFLLVGTIGMSAVGLAVVVGIPDSSGVIHACYSNSQGSVRIVESAADCKNNETAITWNQTGPVGGQGPVGPQGPAGSAGGARAYSNVFPGASPAFNGASGLVGWVSVEAGNFPGDYCLTPNSTIVPGSTVLVLSAGGPGAGASSGDSIIWDGFCGGSPLRFRVVTFRNGSISDLVPFTAMLP